MSNIIKYASKEFTEYKNDIYEYIRTNYSDVYDDLNDGNVGGILIDLISGVADNLSYNIDRSYQETQLFQAQKLESLYEIARTFGFNIPQKRPSITALDFTVNVPILGDSPNSSYYPIINSGCQVIGGSVSFETIDVVDFSSPYNKNGYPNRSIVPVLDANGGILSYNITKRELAVSSKTKYFKKYITVNETTPFYEVILPDNNVISIDSVILVEDYSKTYEPTYYDYYTHDYRYFEVDNLTEKEIFIEKDKKDSNEFPDGDWIKIDKKFIKEYLYNGTCKLTFGGGEDYSYQNNFLDDNIRGTSFLNNIIKNSGLGVKLKQDHTLFIKYRVGGGSASNVGVGTLNTLGAYTIRVLGSRKDINDNVKKSLKVTNPIPSVGGNDGIDENTLRHVIAYNYSSQNRGVVERDYLNLVYKMPGIFGSPYRANAFKERNKIVLSLLTLDENGKLSNTNNNVLIENLSRYISRKRMINDFVLVRSGYIFNISIVIELLVDRNVDFDISNNIIQTIYSIFDIKNNYMDNDIYITNIIKSITKIENVLNIINIKMYNKFGGEYSQNKMTSQIKDLNTMEIDLRDNVLYSNKESMFEIKYPEKDIIVKFRR